MTLHAQHLHVQPQSVIADFTTFNIDVSAGLHARADKISCLSYSISLGPVPLARVRDLCMCTWLPCTDQEMTHIELRSAGTVIESRIYRRLMTVRLRRLSNIVLTEAEMARDGWPIIAAGRQIGSKQSSQRQLQVAFSC